MPLSASPHLPPAVEISGDIVLQENHKVDFTSELPIRPHTSPSTFSQPGEEDMAMIVPSDNNHMQPAYIPLGPETMPWAPQSCFAPQPASAFCSPAYHHTSSPYAEHSLHAQNGASYQSNHYLHSPGNWAATRLRDFNSTDVTGLPRDATPSYPPSAFHHSPLVRSPVFSLPETSTPQLMQLNDDYDLHYANFVNQEDQYEHTSPFSGMSRATTPYSTGYDDDEPIDKEQPYAQLIYRALLAAPQHTMVLRDIYDWFKMHTDKAAHSETKGWQNSIRHNLSMNGAFEKVDTPTDSSTKGFMWRLTPAALREGVKSTTRYRSKVPHKRSSRNPLPQRQASGAKGGHAARRATQRRSQRARDMYHTPGVPRSEPYSASGYVSEWDDCVYAPPNPYPSRVDSPYSQMSFSPYTAPKENVSYSSMPGLASHLMSPPRSYANSPVAPEASVFMGGGNGEVFGAEQAGEMLFEASPTPPAEEPATPINARAGNDWEQDVPLDMDVYEELSQFGADM